MSRSVHFSMKGLLAAVILAIIAVISTALAVQRVELAKEYYEHGKYLWDEHHQATDAIVFLRAATRLNPSEFQYWFDLGEVELAAGESWRARNRFEMALKLHPSCHECPEKIKQIDSMYWWKDYSENVLNELTSPIPTVSVASWLNGIALNKRQPFIIRNAAKYWNMESLQPSQLASAHGIELTESYPQNMRGRPEKLYTMTLREALEFIQFPKSAFASVDASSSGMYIQWNMNRTLFEQLISSMSNTGAVEVPLCVDVESDGDVCDINSNIAGTPVSFGLFQSLLQFPRVSILFDTCLGPAAAESVLTALHWFMVTVGERNAGMFFHQDKLPTSSWQLQATGSKAWRLCPPIEGVHGVGGISREQAADVLRNVRHRKHAVGKDEFSDDWIDYDTLESIALSELHTLVQNIYESADFFDHCDTEFSSNCKNASDYATEEKNGLCYEGTVRDGDLIYYPAGWWHQTLNLDDINLAISSSLLNSDEITHMQEFVEIIVQECKNVIIDVENVHPQRYLLQSPNYKFSGDVCRLLIQECSDSWSPVYNVKNSQ